MQRADAPTAPVEALRDAGGAALTVSGLAMDHRQLRPGDGFVALAGGRAHGLDFLDAATEAGAVALVVDAAEPRAVPTDLPLARVPRLRQRLGELARAVYGPVDQRLALIGITGTDGKTSSAHFIAQLLDEPSSRCALLGTVGNGFREALSRASHTTGDVFALYRSLAELADAGATRVAMEVSSHALDQDRVAGLQFSVAALSNLGVDHLDYHGDRAAYAAAKARLFDGRARRAVLNRDDDFGRELAARCPGGLGFGLESTADGRAQQIEHRPDGLRVTLSVHGEQATLELGLLGDFNVANVLLAAAVAEAIGLSPSQILDRLPGLQPVIGRAELISVPGGPAVVIDYAHTAQALAAILDTVRAHVPGKLWCVFGCGGDRDRSKRPEMAAAVAVGADALVLTSDNPRSEQPAAIIDDMVAGLPAGADHHIEADRATAIAWALAAADRHDCVLIAGKGHEDYQEIAGRRVPFSDHDQVRAWRAGRG